MAIVKPSIRILDLNELNITPPISAIGSDAYFIVTDDDESKKLKYESLERSLMFSTGMYLIQDCLEELSGKVLIYGDPNVNIGANVSADHWIVCTTEDTIAKYIELYEDTPAYHPTDPHVLYGVYQDGCANVISGAAASVSTLLSIAFEYNIFKKFRVKNLSATDLTTDNANITNLTATSLTATNLTATNESVTYSGISNLTATNLTATNLTATFETVTDLTATNETVTNLTATNLTATNETVTNLTATSITGNLKGKADSATEADKLTTSTAGTVTKPVYFLNGVPNQCRYGLSADVQGNATTSYAGLMSAADKTKLDKCYYGNVSLRTGDTSAPIDIIGLIHLLNSKGYLTYNTPQHLVVQTMLNYASNDILTFTDFNTKQKYQCTLAGALIEFNGSTSENPESTTGSENFFLKITLPPLTSGSVTGYVANYGVVAIYINHRQITNTYNYGWRVYMPDGMTATLRSWK